ncbi:MAG: hypothetical protein JW836_17320 [Deltaproteobacteria bacterium]|nr:hypothetical protein [Deltaproteobacteria bacterium]
MGKIWGHIALFLWISVPVTSAWAVDPREPHDTGHYLQDAFSYPYTFSLNANPNPFPFMNPKGRSLHPPDNPSPFSVARMEVAIERLKALHETGLRNYSLSLGSLRDPGMKSPSSFEAALGPENFLILLNLEIPLDQFYLKGSALFGRNTELLSLAFKGSPEERTTQRGLFGYKIAGGYRFNDCLSIQAGWGQAAQESDNTIESLWTWYLQAQIILGWRISVIPQMGLIEFTKGDGEKTEEKAFYCGARWQINF